MKKLLIFSFLIIFVLSTYISAEETNPLYQCNNNIDDDGDNLIDFPADPGCLDLTDDNETNVNMVPVEIADYRLIEIKPNEIQLGDTQINLLIENTGDTKLEDLGALVTGDGISTYNMEPIGALHPDERGYILLWINAKKAGDIELKIKIGTKTFTEELVVIDPNAGKQTQQGIDTEKLNKLNQELDNFTSIYDSYKQEYRSKKDSGYDVSGIDFGQIEKDIRDAEVASTKKDVLNLEASIVLIKAELKEIKSGLDSAEEKGIKDIIKENLPLISGLLGSIVMFFAVWEILKKKKGSLDKSITLLKEKKQSIDKSIKTLKKTKKELQK